MPKNMPTSAAPARSGYDDWISRTSSASIARSPSQSRPLKSAT
jgi:hypothetical protein